jgi:hypothetical protein
VFDVSWLPLSAWSDVPAPNCSFVAEAKLQDVISGPARPTVTSVSGVASEVGAVAIYAEIATGASWLTVSTVLAIAIVPAFGGRARSVRGASLSTIWAR